MVISLSRVDPATRKGHLKVGGRVPVSRQAAWYAVHCRPRHEKQVAKRLRAKGFEVFLPLVRHTRTRAGRRINVELPLFSCYLFVCSEHYQLQDAGWTPGVIRVLGVDDRQYVLVPTHQIQAIKSALDSDLSLDPHPYLREGQPVRVRRGPLAGLEGILIRKDRHHRLVVSIDIIAKSASVVVDADDVAVV